jgi:NAD(P)-dependent dehydrogenase (short-subunit alcohol dehydrogenase family)
VTSRDLTDRYLDGCTVTVTGGGSGQGRASALRLADLGAAVAVIDRSQHTATAVVEEIEAAGGRAIAVPVDIADRSAVADAFAEVRQWGSCVRVLAAAAGIYMRPALAVDRPVAEAEEILAVNTLGTYYCCVEAARQMREAGEGGRIILWSSIAGALGQVGDVAYCASKAAVEGMGRGLAAELGPDGITVNVISPGAVGTPMIAGVDLRFYDALLPGSRIGTPEEIAELVVFLTSPAARFLTGAVIPVDGGVSAINGLLILASRLQRLEGASAREAERAAASGTMEAGAE